MRITTRFPRCLFLAVSVAVAGSACGPDGRTESVTDRQKADGRPANSGQRVQFSARRTVLDYTDRSLELPEVDTATLRASYGDAETFGRIAAIYPRPEEQVIVVADHLMDPHLVSLDMESRGVLDRFGPQGQGPGEFRQVSTLFRDSAEPLTLRRTRG